MITMEASSDEWTEQDLACLARIDQDAAGLRPLYRRALERSRAKLQSGLSCSSKEREILARIASL
jgi:hypothetical protein